MNNNKQGKGQRVIRAGVFLAKSIRMGRSEQVTSQQS